MTVTQGPRGWLLLIFNLPAKQAAQRVEIWRKLRRYGALALPSSGYVLPNGAANQEKFEWLAAAIRKYRGQASVATVNSFDDLPDARLRQMFADARSGNYRDLLQQLKKVGNRGPRHTGKLSRLRRKFQEISAIDFFNSPLRSRVEMLLSQTSEGPTGTKVGSQRGKREFRGRTWVTRFRPGIDRCASAWLIRKFIDASAKFVFAADASKHREAVPFDMFGEAGFGHRGEDCTFETLRREFAIRDPKVGVVAQIVHDADLDDEKFGRNEGAGLDRALIGWAQQGIPDDELLRRGMELMEGLYNGL